MMLERIGRSDAMKIIVNVTDSELRGVPFPDYSRVLLGLLGETYWTDDIQVKRAGTPVVLIEDGTDDVDPKEILEMASVLTEPDHRSEFFK
jgi:hypothetical protein